MSQTRLCRSSVLYQRLKFALPRAGSNNRHSPHVGGLAFTTQLPIEGVFRPDQATIDHALPFQCSISNQHAAASTKSPQPITAAYRQVLP